MSSIHFRRDYPETRCEPSAYFLSDDKCINHKTTEHHGCRVGLLLALETYRRLPPHHTSARLLGMSPASSSPKFLVGACPQNHKSIDPQGLEAKVGGAMVGMY